MSFRIKRLLAASLLLLITILLAACGAAPDVPDTGDTDSGDTDSEFEGVEDIENEEDIEEEEIDEEDTEEESGGQFDPTSAFNATDCPYEAPSNLNIECGFLTVPENRTMEGSADIRLMIAIVHADSPTAEPIVYLAGGPGSSGIDEFFQDVEGWEAYGFFGERDVVFVDQRGTGFSEPTLNCPEVEEVDMESGSDNPELDATIACHDRLADEGVDLTAYNTTENAADIDAIRQALGYDEWNLFGISYGTRLATVIMRNHPDGVRAAIIDGVYPLQVDSASEEAPNLWAAIQGMIAACTDDPDCGEAYPDLENVLIQTVADLNASPADYAAIDFETGEESEATLTGDDLLNTISQVMYDSSSIPLLPRVIYDASEGNFESYALLSGSMGMSRPRQDDEDVSDSEGMMSSVECHDEYAFADLDEAEATLDGIPEELQSGLYGAQSWFDTCEVWGAGEANDSLNAPVSSDIPTLVLSGEFDPVTPPSWGALAAETLSQSYAYTVRGGGHSVSGFDECLVHVVNQFLDDPTVEPDATCIQDIAAPAWIMPDDPLDMFEE